jgi:hypothetical protein
MGGKVYEQGEFVVECAVKSQELNVSGGAMA